MDSRTGESMVIERKALVWPPDEAERHVAMHDFMDRLPGQDWAAAPRTLTLGPLPNLVDRTIRHSLARQLRAEVDAVVGDLAVGSTHHSATPFPWMLRHEHPGERDGDEQQAGLIISVPLQPPNDLSDPANLPAPFVDALQTLLTSADRKFQSHSGSRKVLVIDPYPEPLFMLINGTWLSQALPQLDLPNSIDEIWIAHDYGDGDWLFELVHPYADVSDQHANAGLIK